MAPYVLSITLQSLERYPDFFGSSYFSISLPNDPVLTSVTGGAGDPLDVVDDSQCRDSVEVNDILDPFKFTVVRSRGSKESPPVQWDPPCR